MPHRVKLDPVSLRTALAAGCLLLCPALSAAPVVALAFSPDGAALVSNGNRRLVIRSPKDATLQRHIACDLPKITSLAFAPHGKMLAAGGGDPGVQGEVLLFTWPDGTFLRRFAGHKDLVTGLDFDPDGTRLGVASSDGQASIWRCDSEAGPSDLLRFTDHAAPLFDIAFSPSGEILVTAGADRSLKVWNSRDGVLQRSLDQHSKAIHALTFQPHASSDASPLVCATASDDYTVRLWQPETGRMIRIVRHHEGPVLALAWAADGASLFSAGKEGIIRRIDGGSDRIQRQWHAHDDWIYALALSPDGTTLASGDWSGNVRLHDIRPAAPEMPSPAPERRP
ncbi:MAG TPA: WD40 repeat domain-containing protein [Verrucomicrobiales bacterium]|nr:WD40 repeat domain-containing protein [Verrucomicrobiales bacterium]